LEKKLHDDFINHTTDFAIDYSLVRCL